MRVSRRAPSESWSIVYNTICDQTEWRLYAMDHEKYITLMQVFQGIPDPRKARGKRYPWLYLLALIGAAPASGQQTPHAIAHWVVLHGPELIEHLCPPRSSIPSESAIRRTVLAEYYYPSGSSAVQRSLMGHLLVTMGSPSSPAQTALLAGFHGAGSGPAGCVQMPRVSREGKGVPQWPISPTLTSPARHSLPCGPLSAIIAAQQYSPSHLTSQGISE